MALSSIERQRGGEDAHATASAPLERDITDFVRMGTELLARSRRAPAALVQQFDRAWVSLTSRTVAEAFARPAPVEDERSLARALATRTTTAVPSAATSAILRRVVRRLAPARFFLRRTPAFLLTSAGPAVYGSVSRGADELRLIASHLVLRARAAGIEPDPERVRRVAIQVLGREPADPGHRPGSRRVGTVWLRRAMRAFLPLARPITTADPTTIAALAATVPVASLAAPVVVGGGR